MKLYADYKIHNGYKKINIWYIYNGYKKYNIENHIDFREYYKKYFKNRLFSTHKSTKMAMTLVRKQPYGKSFFRYLGNLNNNGEFESVSHSVYKEIITDLNILNLVVNEQKIKLYISYSDIEFYFTANGNNYVADVFVYFNKSEPMEYFYKWKGILCFEIKYKHAVDKRKVDDCYVEGIPVFEHTISKKLMISDNTINEEELISQKNFITNKLTDKIYGKLLSDPESEEYKLIEKLKKENDELRNENSKLQNCNAILMEVNNKQNIRIKELQDKYKKIENKKILKFILKIFRIN